MHTQTRIAHDAPSLLTVQAPEDIEFLSRKAKSSPAGPAAPSSSPAPTGWPTGCIGIRSA
jgi:hypothetical protein